MPRDRQQVGKRPSAKLINYGVEARDLIDSITGGGGVNVTTGKNGVAVALGASVPGRELGITTSTITAASGTTPGSGTVSLYQPTYGGGAAVSPSVSLTVYNWSVNKTVANSAHVMICKIHGVWFVDWADCS